MRSILSRPRLASLRKPDTPMLPSGNAICAAMLSRSGVFGATSSLLATSIVGSLGRTRAARSDIVAPAVKRHLDGSVCRLPTAPPAEKQLSRRALGSSTPQAVGIIRLKSAASATADFLTMDPLSDRRGFVIFLPLVDDPIIQTIVPGWRNLFGDCS